MEQTDQTTGQEKDFLSSFSPEEKEGLFQGIVDMYYRKNFGTMSKTELETYLFSFYLDCRKAHGFNQDDYVIGRDLGITQSRVRSLKERKQLKYPTPDYDWRKSFLKYAENARYDDVKKLMKFAILDVNVLKDARYYFESHQYYDEYQLNPKLFQCTTEAFWELGQQLAREEGEEFNYKLSPEAKAELETIKDSPSAMKKILEGSAEEGIRELLLSGSKVASLAVLNKILPGCGSIAGVVVKALITVLEGK